MSLEHSTRAITENKFLMQLYADRESLKSEIARLSEGKASEYSIKQKEYELSQVENRIKGKDYTSVRKQCEQYFLDNKDIIDSIKVIAETKERLSRGETVNEWPHLAAVFLLKSGEVASQTQALVQGVKNTVVVQSVTDSPTRNDALKSDKDEATKLVVKEKTERKKDEKKSDKKTQAVSNKGKGNNVQGAGSLVEKKTSKPRTEESSTKKELNNTLKTSLDSAYVEFMAYARDTDKWFAGFRNSQKDVENVQKALSEKFNQFNNAANSYISSGGNAEDINWMRLNVAYYYTDDFSDVSSKNQMNIVRSQNLCIDILGSNVKKLPTTQDQFYDTFERIKTKNPQLADLISKKISEQSEKGGSFDISAILSNPIVKGSWEKASDEVYGTYLKELDNELDRLKGQQYNTLSESQKKALNHLRDIRGKDGIFDFTVQNREQMWSFIRSGSAIAAGIAVTPLTGGGSLGAIALGIGAGALVTTTGGLLAQGYHGSVGEIAGEAGINLLSFGGGAVLFKIASGARVAAFAGKNLGTATLVYGTESAGNIAIGVGTDMFRAKLHGEDLDVWNSLQQNLIWGALPFALRMRGAKVPDSVMTDANTVNETLQAAGIQTALGKSPKTLLEKLRSPLDRLKTFGQKNKPLVNSEMSLEDFKKLHLSGDALYEKAAKLGGSKKIDIEGLPGYTIGKTSDGKKLEIFTPDGKKYSFYHDKLENNLETFYKKELSSKKPVQPTEASVQNVEGNTTSGNPSKKPETKKNAQGTEEAPTQEIVGAQIKSYKKVIEKAVNSLRKDGDEVLIGEYTVIKEGEKFRIKGPDGEYAGKTLKDVLSKVEGHIKGDTKSANEFINAQLKSHIESIPEGKKFKYGEATISKNKQGKIEIIGKDGKVFNQAEMDAFYQTHAESILNTKIKEFLSTHGNEKIDPSKLKEWYDKERGWYNPISWGKGIVNMTWNEVMQPIQTWNAFLGKGGAFRTLDTPFGMTNNIAKAIVLRDVGMNWKSSDAAMRVIGRGTFLTGATVAAGNMTFGPNILTQIGMIPQLFAYSTISGDTQHTYTEYNKTAISTYYGGMIWGNLVSQMIGGMPHK